VSTFRTLCTDASFDIPEAVLPVPSTTEPSQPSSSKPIGLESLTINIQLTLPETTNSSVYEEIFKAMKKYLLGSSE